MARAFIAVRPPDAVLDAIAALPPVPGRPTTRDQWHITLQFLGNVDIDAINVNLETPTGVARFGGIGTFPGVVWLGLLEGSDTLTALAEEIGTQLGIAEERKYHPHLTLARVKTRIKKRDLPELGPVGGEWPINEVVLYESTLHPEGARYRPCRAWPLRGAS